MGNVKQIGDVIAETGRPLSARTIQNALKELGGDIDSLVLDGRGTTAWSLAPPESK